MNRYLTLQLKPLNLISGVAPIVGQVGRQDVPDALDIYPFMVEKLLTCLPRYRSPASDMTFTHFFTPARQSLPAIRPVPPERTSGAGNHCSLYGRASQKFL